MRRLPIERLLLVAASVLLWPLCAQAELMVGESLEWIVADSDLIVRGTIAKVEAFKDERQTAWERATVQVNETLKGTTIAPPTFLVRCVGIAEKPSEWRQEGVELLLFLVKSSRYESLDPCPSGRRAKTPTFVAGVGSRAFGKPAQRTSNMPSADCSAASSRSQRSRS